MNVNSRYLEEARKIEERWAKTGLLNGITNKFSRSTTAVLLESQRLHNEWCKAPTIFCPVCGLLMEITAESYYGTKNAGEKLHSAGMKCHGCSEHYSWWANANGMQS